MKVEFSKKLLPLIMAGTLSLSLVGCGINEMKTSDYGSDTPKEQPADEDETIADVAEKAVKDEYEKVQGESAVEASITVMMDSFDAVMNATDEYKQTEQYQNDVEKVKQNWYDLRDFVAGDKEINGCTFSELSEPVKEKVLAALEKLSSWAWDKSTDVGAYLKEKVPEWKDTLSEKGAEWLDEMEEKYNEKQR